MLRKDEPEARVLDFKLYAESKTRIRDLKSQLTDDAVEGLAKEVLRRLSERGADVDHAAPSDMQINVLCDALLSDDDNAGARMIEAARTDGASLEEVYLKYLARAAEVLGMRWDDDLVSFTEVTLGTSRMYGIMCALRRQLRVMPQIAKKSAVFIGVPDETHTLGVQMATDLFRRDGWDIDLLVGRSQDEIIARVARSDFSIVGISASGDHSLKALSKLVVALRLSKPEAYIFLSGSVLDEAAAEVELLGLDGAARDFDGAKALMDQFQVANDAR